MTYRVGDWLLANHLNEEEEAMPQGLWIGSYDLVHFGSLEDLEEEE